MWRGARAQSGWDLIIASRRACAWVTVVTLGAHARGLLRVSVCVSVCYRSSCFSVRLDMEPTILKAFLGF